MTSESSIQIQVAEALARRARECEKTLGAMLEDLPATPSRLRESIAYSLFAGGKRLRPALVLEWHDAIAPNDTSKQSALRAACAIELIHTFSLIHDDLPAMDNDDLRRGKPTNHKVFGEAMAILAGDAMTTLAFEQLSYAKPQHIGTLVRELGFASGAQGMVGGQVLDLENENVVLPLRDLQRLHSMKTGALITCACRLGAISADATPEQLDTATAYGQHLGLAFQIMDDVLDETSTAQEMGKATKKDGVAGKNTYPRLLGVKESIELACAEVNRALETIKSLGSAGSTLSAIARFVVERKC